MATHGSQGRVDTVGTVVSVNVGRPRDIDRNDRPAKTAIRKTPVSGRIEARTCWSATTIDTAKPIPSLPPPSVKITSLIPITRALASSNGPPEFPGFMAASV